MDVFDIVVILIVGRVWANAPHFGLLREQSLQYPPPSLRDTSASGGHGMAIFDIMKKSQRDVQTWLQGGE